MMEIESYLFFDGRGEEAVEFYKKALAWRSREGDGQFFCRQKWTG
jgi:hypothetical protein